MRLETATVAAHRRPLKRPRSDPVPPRNAWPPRLLGSSDPWRGVAAVRSFFVLPRSMHVCLPVIFSVAAEVWCVVSVVVVVVGVVVMMMGMGHVTCCMHAFSTDARRHPTRHAAHPTHTHAMDTTDLNAREGRTRFLRFERIDLPIDTNDSPPHRMGRRSTTPGAGGIKASKCVGDGRRWSRLTFRVPLRCHTVYADTCVQQAQYV